MNIRGNNNFKTRPQVLKLDFVKLCSWSEEWMFNADKILQIGHSNVKVTCQLGSFGLPRDQIWSYYLRLVSEKCEKAVRPPTYYWL